MTFTRRAALALLTAATLAAPLAAATPDEIKSKGSVNVGMLVDFPPFGIMDASGKPDGYDADVAKLLADDLGVTLNIVPVTGPNRIPYLLSGQVDLLVASLGITPERAERVDFSEPYAGIAIAVYGLTDVDLSAPEKLAGHTIGVTRASTQDSAVTAVAPDGATIQRFDDDASAVQALLSGQVEAIGVSNIIINQIEQVAPGRFDVKFDLSQQKQGIAVPPGSDALLAEINAFLEKIKADGKLNEIHEKWLGSPLPDFVSATN
ncbi:transporter substrate-binding domain-containing protein [Amaricoccus solimangrovi]|uniref:Transporter substrate-binding domain-containing protein n=1 Tax=Amaricoccus solimangrovi TaxID=2589815 RepID=A0A501WI15_9RHOB|nr:transporter substrate-binding domain-containing protein [Amaricoccus solimangrovi]TPE49533.1 transporter substrate-binding domain-containing protein [Amaricoccus solimangrovi]